MANETLMLGGGRKPKKLSTKNKDKLFSTVEDMARITFAAATEQIKAETEEYGPSFWMFPYTRPATSLGTGQAWLLAPKEQTKGIQKELAEEARSQLRETTGAVLKALEAIPADFAKLTSLMAEGSLPIENTWFLPIKEKALSEQVVTSFLVDMGWAHEGETDYAKEDVMYLALCAACALCGERSLKAALRKNPRKPTSRPSLVRTEKLTLPNDAITKALFGRGENHLTPADYMSGLPRKIRTGKNLSATVLVQNDFDITEACETYQLNDVDRFWLESLCSIAKEGHLEISGRDLLKVNGFANPRSPNMRNTLKEAFDSIFKAARTWITIDASDEEHAYAKSLGTELALGVILKRVINAEFSLMKFTDGRADFTIRLIPDEDGDPLSALPLAKYASNKRQLIDATTDDFVFEGLSVKIEHKRMWRYVVRRISEKSTSNTILCETMLRELGCAGITKQKRSNVLAKLEEMLEARMRDKDELMWLSEKKAAEGLSRKEAKKLSSLRKRKLVKSYSVNKRGRVKTSYTIEFW